MVNFQCINFGFRSAMASWDQVDIDVMWKGYLRWLLPGHLKESLWKGTMLNIPGVRRCCCTVDGRVDASFRPVVAYETEKCCWRCIYALCINMHPIPMSDQIVDETDDLLVWLTPNSTLSTSCILRRRSFFTHPSQLHTYSCLPTRQPFTLWLTFLLSSFYFQPSISTINNFIKSPQALIKES